MLIFSENDTAVKLAMDEQDQPQLLSYPTTAHA